MKRLWPFLLIVVCFLWAGTALAGKKKPAPRKAVAGSSVKDTFARMKTALQKKDNKLFKEQWHPKGYAKNLVGGSGLPGRGVYKQGSRKGWHLKPNLTKQIKVSKTAVIVPCAIWSWKRKRAMDHVHALLVWRANKWMVLGAGEKLKEVQKLAKGR